MKHTGMGKVEGVFLDKMTAEMWDVLAQLKSFSDRLGLETEVGRSAANIGRDKCNFLIPRCQY